MKAAGGRYRLPQRKTYALVTAAYAAFVVYGSLVPLEFRARSLEEVLDQFVTILSRPVSVAARTDVATNILLFIPYAYLLMAALCTDRRGRIGRSAAALLTIASGVALCLGIEFLQLFSIGRTAALSDIIAETCGGIVGVVLWLFVGEAVTAWLRDFSQERERPVLAQRVLLVYCLGLFVSQVLPLDLTLNLGELAQKYRNGRIVLQPFVYSYPSLFDQFWDYFADIMLNVPIGAAAVVLWTHTRRRPAVALSLGIASVALIELCQVFVISRVAAVTDVLTGSIGVLLGVGVATALLKPSSALAPRRTANSVATLARFGVAAWALMLVAYHWSPFDFSFDPERVALGVRQLLTVPFYGYYQGAEFQAFTEMTRKALLAVPLGALLHFSWPKQVRTSTPGTPGTPGLRLIMLTVIGSCLMLAVEVGQVFLPTRFPDVTDGIFGGLGVLAGLWVTGLLVAPLRDRALTGRVTPGASLRS